MSGAEQPDLERALRLAEVVSRAWVDPVTAEVVTAFERAGVDVILLKGPATRSWLYGDGSPRPYVDSDLLVSAREFHRAQAALNDLGFVQRVGDEDIPGWQQHAHPWLRVSDGAKVDLHRSIAGARAAPEKVWDVLSAQRDTMQVGGVTASVLPPAARAMHVAMHALQDAHRRTKSRQDLVRALEMVDHGTWSEAAALADQIDATAAFAAGLRLDPHGHALAAELGLLRAGSVDGRLQSAGPPPGALAFEHIATLPGWPAKLRAVGRKLVPTRRYMRFWSPLAARGPLGLTAAYALRPAWVLFRLYPAFTAWRRARRESRSG